MSPSSTLQPWFWYTSFLRTPIEIHVHLFRHELFINYKHNYSLTNISHRQGIFPFGNHMPPTHGNYMPRIDGNYMPQTLDIRTLYSTFSNDLASTHLLSVMRTITQNLAARNKNKTDELSVVSFSRYSSLGMR